MKYNFDEIVPRKHTNCLKYDNVMEIFGTESTARLLLAKKLLTINNSRYPLIEFSFTGSGEQETYILESVINAGYVPIVAHPERYKYMQENPILLNTWKSLGCLFQINQGSFLGHFGEHARFIAYEMTARGFSSVVALTLTSSMSISRAFAILSRISSM